MVACLISHGFTFVLIGIILLFAVDNYRLAKLSPFPYKEIRMLICLVLLFQVVTMLVFGILQFRWIIGNSDLAIGTVDSYGWIAYDHLNKLFHLSIGVILNGVLRYRLENVSV